MKELTFTYKDTSQIDEEKLWQTAARLDDYIGRLSVVVQAGGYKTDESSVNLVDDTELYEAVSRVVDEKKTDSLKYIIVCGIGGSALGTRAVYEGVFGKNRLDCDSAPQLIFFETVSDTTLAQIDEISQSIKSLDEVVVLVISKSGSTTETIVNFEIVARSLSDKFEDSRHRVVAITQEGSQLDIHAVERSITTLHIPAKVGGRFSVFSAVGLLPLLLAGIDIHKLLSGARHMREYCLTPTYESNPAVLSAALIHIHNQAGIMVNNSFFFSPRLESVGKWYRQLMGESIGKKYDILDNEVHAGIVPIVSIGSTDLHSMAQLYFGGPRNIFATLVSVEKQDSVHTVSDEPLLGKLVSGIEGKSAHKVMEAIYQGMRKSYYDAQLPFVEVRLCRVNEYTIGAYMQFKMMEMMYLAKLMGVNAFNQPDVEGYKETTRKILGGN